MNRRIVPYGYCIENGCCVVSRQESQIVRRIFSLYIMGESYARIAETLNGEQVRYLEEHPVWNKHIVKRILENRKYIGEQQYPPIISNEEYDAVRCAVVSKTETLNRNEGDGTKPIWKYLSCPCGGKLIRTGGGPKNRNLVNLKCKQCGASRQVNRGRLMDQILNSYNEYGRENVSEYVPSTESVSLNNSINRSLEKPNNPEEIIQKIYQGITARFRCCMIPEQNAEIQKIEDVDWSRFERQIQRIRIDINGIITIIPASQET